MCVPWDVSHRPLSLQFVHWRALISWVFNCKTRHFYHVSEYMWILWFPACKVNKVQADAYTECRLAGCFCLLRAQACLEPVLLIMDPLVLSGTFILRHIKHTIYVAQPIKIAICHLGCERPVKLTGIKSQLVFSPLRLPCSRPVYVPFHTHDCRMENGYVWDFKEHTDFR